MKQRNKTLLVLAGLAGLAMHIYNRMEYSNAMVKETLSCQNGNYYEWRFGKIRYFKKGSGSALLLLHDFTVGSSSYEYHKIIDKLAQTHEVYCIDFIGYGLSDKPDMTYTNYLFVQLVSDFIKNVIGRKADIIACGDAVPAAIMVCHNDNSLVNNLVGINPPSLYQLNQIPSRQTRILKLFLEAPVVGTFIYNLHTSKTAFMKKFQEKYFYSSHNFTEQDITAYVEAAHTPDRHSKHTYASYVGRYMNTNIIHALKKINNSIFLIAGDDKEDSHTLIDNYKYYNPAIETVFIKNTRHLPHLENPEKVLAQLDTFLG